MMPDHFEFMGVPRALAFDPTALQGRYFQLSREYHPDFHTMGGEDARQESLERTSLLNQAYRTLRDPFERARYLISLEWPDLPEDEKKRIPPALLMEVMEMQEKVAEVQFESDPARAAALRNDLLDIERRLRAKTDALRSELDAIAAEWDALPADPSPETKQPILTRLNTLLNTRAYLRTLLATIDAAIHGGEGVKH